MLTYFNNIIKRNKLVSVVLLITLFWYLVLYLNNFTVFNNINHIKYDFYMILKSDCQCKNDSDIIIFKTNQYDKYYQVNLSHNSLDKSIHLYNITDEEFKNMNLTCDLYKVLRRGRAQNVIGYSLYGKNRFYYDKLINLTHQIKHLYPDWSMRVYYDNSIDKSIICEVECQTEISNDNVLVDNSDFCFVESLDLNIANLYNENKNKKNNKIKKLNGTYMHSMKWRWLPIGDRFVNRFISRDTDNYILSREVDAVNEWFNSKKAAHLMRGLPLNFMNYIFSIFYIFHFT